MTAHAARPPRHGPTLAERLSLQQKLGGIVPPLLTAVFAFLMGGAVVAATGRNPVEAYKGIFQGAGLDWFFHLPWTTDTNLLSTYNLTQTLLQSSSLILTGLAVAFAFRCGLFNIGAQGQYMVGLIVANWVGISMVDVSKPIHVLVAVGAATLAGAVWAGIAGLLKATVGAHEVITTIMLNWVAYWFGSYVFGQGGPLQNPATPTNPISADVADSAKLPVFWGDPVLQGLHIGFFVAIAALILYSLLINRTTLGFEVRSVGYNPDAAAYGGMSVARSFFLAMAISGAFAGLAGGLDMLGYLFHFGTLDVQSNSVGFMAIAVALLGRSTSIGVFVSAILFGGLLYGTTKGLDPAVFDPTLAGNLTSMIQGLVVLFVGADVLILWLWNLRRRRRPRRPAEAEA
jgi:simple sugar transport system permease protein